MPALRLTPVLLVLFVFGARADDEPDLKQMLSSGLPETREEAARLLGKQGDTAAAKRLMELANDKDWGVRIEAYRALGPIPFSPGHEALRNAAINGEIRPIRTLAAEMLRDHDARDAAQWLARNLKRYKKEARLPLIHALGVIGNAEAIEAIEKQMAVPDPTYRIAAARALDASGKGEAGLTRGLKDKETVVRLLSVVALARIDTDTARESVLDFLGRGRGRDEWDPWVLRRIGRGFARSNADAATAQLVPRIAKTKDPDALLQIAIHGKLKGCATVARKHLKARRPLTRAFAYTVAGLGDEALTDKEVDAGLNHKERFVNFAATRAYLATSGRELTVALSTVLGHKKGDVVQVGIRKAVEIKATESLPDLLAVAEGKSPVKKDWQTRVAACVAAGKIGKRDAYDALVALTKDRNWTIKAAAIEGLYHCYETRAIPLLIDFFDHRNPVVRMTTRRNLRYMTRKHYPKRQLYVDWWKKHGGTFEWVAPDEQERRARKHGYATPKYITEILRGTDIVAIKGRWDKVELILEDLGVKHMAVRQQQIKDYGLSPKQVVLVNCEGSVDTQVTAYLQWFVCAGGYMATTDWALVNALDKTFRGVVKGYVKQSTGNDVVIVQPATPGHPTIEGVFHESIDLKWWLEIQAFPIAIEDPIRSTVLVDSLEMYLRYGSSVMMVDFPAGLGKVMHSTSHFYLQKEGFAQEPDPLRRKIFAADHLGLSMKEIRELDAKGAFDDANKTTSISKSYSMFLMLVNFIDEKRTIDKTK